MYTVEQSDISAFINDFETFCNYVDEKKPVLTKAKANFIQKNLFELNSFLINKKEVMAPTYRQESYYFIDFAFSLAILGNLYVQTDDEKGNKQLTRTARKDEYDALNIYEKYVFLLETFWTKYDIDALVKHCRIDKSFSKTIETFAESSPYEELRKGVFHKGDDNDSLFSYNAKIIHILSFLGFCTFEPVVLTQNHFNRGDDTIESVAPTKLGVHLCKILKNLDLSEWNNTGIENPYGGLEMIMFNLPDQFRQILKATLSSKEEHKKDELKNNEHISFSKQLSPVFPKGMLHKTVTAGLQKNHEAAYTFKVSLEKNLWRKIVLSNKHTMEDLHNTIQRAFNFDNDHLYSFFMDGKEFSQNAIHSPGGVSDPYASEAVLGDLLLYAGQKICYLFDYGDLWLFDVLLLEINQEAKPPELPEIIESMGNPPVQYNYDEDDDYGFEDEDDEYDFEDEDDFVDYYEDGDEDE